MAASSEMLVDVVFPALADDGKTRIIGARWGDGSQTTYPLHLVDYPHKPLFDAYFRTHNQLKRLRDDHRQETERLHAIMTRQLKINEERHEHVRQATAELAIVKAELEEVTNRSAVKQSLLAQTHVALTELREENAKSSKLLDQKQSLLAEAEKCLQSASAHATDVHNEFQAYRSRVQRRSKRRRLVYKKQLAERDQYISNLEASIDQTFASPPRRSSSSRRLRVVQLSPTSPTYSPTSPSYEI